MSKYLSVGQRQGEAASSVGGVACFSTSTVFFAAVRLRTVRFGFSEGWGSSGTVTTSAGSARTLSVGTVSSTTGSAAVSGKHSSATGCSAASSGTTGSAGASGITASSSVFFLGILLSSLAHILVDMMESLSVLTNSPRLAEGLFGRGAHFGCSGFGVDVGAGFLRHSGIWAEALQSRSFFAS